MRTTATAVIALLGGCTLFYAPRLETVGATSPFCTGHCTTGAPAPSPAASGAKQ